MRYIMEDDIKLENHMGPKEAYKTFKEKLLEKLKLPADQPNFVAWLKEKGVITDERTMKNLEMSCEETEGNRAIFILEEIEKSLPDSDTKFINLLSVMEEYKQGLETLAWTIQSHLDPIGKDFDCEAMGQYLSHNLESLSNLPYQQIVTHLIARGVITYDKRTDDDMERYKEHDKKYPMRFVLNEIRTRLVMKQPKKFKSFLEILEKSDDQRLQEKAKELGGSKRVPPIGEAPTFNIILIPVGQSDIQCDGKSGGSYLWKGHDFGITLPPDCADGTVTITLKAYLPCSTQNHCLASAVFQIITNVEEFKKPIKLSLSHWVNINIKSETDKEKLQFLVFKSNPYGILQGSTQESFEVGESFASIEVSQVLLISVCKKIVAARFAFSVAKDFQFHTDQILISTPTNYEALIISEERYTTEATGSKAAENKYLDLLILPAEGCDEKWGIYCIALNNPTYLQAIMKYFIDEHQISLGIQVLKRRVIFKPATDGAVANLRIVDTKADGKIIKIIHNKQISKQKIDSLDLRTLGSRYVPIDLGSQYLPIHSRYTYEVFEIHEINFPTWCSLNIIGKLSPSSSKLKVEGLCGIKEESSEFSLASPIEYGYKFETYEHVKPVIVKSKQILLYNNPKPGDKRKRSTSESDDAKNSVLSASPPAQIKLFISYAWEEATNDFVEKLKTDLEAKGLKIFLDKHDILPGDNIQREVAKGIDEADGIIIVYSERYPDSQWCSRELQMAQDLDKKVFPVRRIKDPYQKNVNLSLGGILYANFILDDEVKYQNSLASLIKGIEKNCVKEI